MKSNENAIARKTPTVFCYQQYCSTYYYLIRSLAPGKSTLLIFVLLYTAAAQAQNLQNGLIAKYTFCDCSAKDVSGNNRHGIMVGNPQCEKGRIDHGLLLNQAADTNSCGQRGGQYVVLPTLGAVWSPGFSIAAWVRFDDLKTYQRIIDFGNGNGEAGGMNVLFGREINSNNLILESWVDKDGIQARTVGRLTAKNAITTGKIEHYCATVSGDTMRIYVNGVLVAQKKGNPIANVIRTRNYIGRSSWCKDDPDFKGLVDEVRIYNRSLSSEDVRMLYGAADKNFTIQSTCSAPERVNFVFGNRMDVDSLKWNFGDQRSGSMNTAIGPSAWHTYSDTGNYTVRLIVHKNCLNDTIVKTVRVNKISRQFLGPDFDICRGSMITLSSNASASSYLWQNGSTNDTLAISKPGTYWLQIRVDSCTYRDSVIVGSLRKYATLIKTVCEGQQLYGYNSSGIYQDTFALTNGCDSIRILQLTVQQSKKLKIKGSVCDGQRFSLPWGQQVSAAGIYRDTLRSVNGCDSLFREVTVVVSPLPTVQVTKSNDIDCTLRTATLTATGGAKYTWRPSSTLGNHSGNKAMVNPNATTVYYVKGITTEGCSNEDSIKVNVTSNQSGEGFFVPSAFTPNGDGKNDFFGMSHWGSIKNFRLTISNRWGETVFTCNDVSKSWDGCYRGQRQATATYVYLVSGETDCGIVNKKGTVLLIR